MKPTVCFEAAATQATTFRVTLFPQPGVTRFFSFSPPLRFDGLSASRALTCGADYFGDRISSKKIRGFKCQTYQNHE